MKHFTTSGKSWYGAQHSKPMASDSVRRAETLRAVSTERGSTVPGVDFNAVRAEITMEHVLTLIGFQPARRSGAQWYGICPLHGSASARRRSFSVNVAIGRYYCHGCRSHGNQMDLWAAVTNLPLHQAAIALCRRLGRDVPWVRRW